MNLDAVREMAAAIRAEVAKAVVGQDSVVDHLLIALLAGGHVLLEGPPGTAKTLLAQSFAVTLGLVAAVRHLAPRQVPRATVAAGYVIGGLSSAWFIARTFV